MLDTWYLLLGAGYLVLSTWVLVLSSKGSYRALKGCCRVLKGPLGGGGLGVVFFGLLYRALLDNCDSVLQVHAVMPYGIVLVLY